MRERNRRRLTCSRLQLNVQFIHARVLTRLPASPDEAELHGSLSRLGVVLRAGFPHCRLEIMSVGAARTIRGSKMSLSEEKSLRPA